MDNLEVFPLVQEQNHLDVTVSALNSFFEKFDFLVNSVDTAGQRKELENLLEAYSVNRHKPYFGAFATHNEFDGGLEYVRVGKMTIHDAKKNTVVVNWTTKEGQRYVQIERESSNQSFSAQIEILNDKVVQIIESNSARALQRRARSQAAKSGELGDIVDVIHPDQDDVVRVDHQGALVIEGGPGTGKTVVALQRIAYLLLREGSRYTSDAEILVVGPTSAYSKYVKGFFPSLGIGRVRNEDFQSICLTRLTDSEVEEFKNLPEERDGVVRTKNSANVLRVIQGSIWPNQPLPNFEVSVNLGQGRPNLVLLDEEFLENEVRAERQRFLEGAVSFTQARNALRQRINNKIFRNETNVDSKSNRTADARRNELFEFWLMKIGLRNMEERSKFLKILESPSGGRYRRAMSSLMNEFYKQDIEFAIELVSDQQSSDIQLLRQILVDLGAPVKTAGGTASTEEIGLNDSETIQIEISEEEARRNEDGNFPLAVEQIVQRIAPSVNPLSLARRICRGDTKLFEIVLGPSGVQVAQRLAEAATSRLGNKNYEWVDADLPIIAEVKYLVEGNQGLPSYSHVVIDEAQDLTRLQARVLSRFINSSQVTLVGDLNQATRSGSLASWLAITSEFGVDDLRVETLKHNYRVPQNIYDYARLYLSEDDRIDTPSCDIEGGDVRLIEVGPAEAVTQLRDHVTQLAHSGERVVVISQDESLKETVLNWGIPNTEVLTPEESKGLEVDHSVLLQPNRWFRDAGRIRNLMYVVLTRATKSVTILQHEPERFGIIIPEDSD